MHLHSVTKPRKQMHRISICGQGYTFLRGTKRGPGLSYELFGTNTRKRIWGNHTIPETSTYYHHKMVPCHLLNSVCDTSQRQDQKENPNNLNSLIQLATDPVLHDTSFTGSQLLHRWLFYRQMQGLSVMTKGGGFGVTCAILFSSLLFHKEPGQQFNLKAKWVVLCRCQPIKSVQMNVWSHRISKLCELDYDFYGTCISL